MLLSLIPLVSLAVSPVHPSFSYEHCGVQTSLQPVPGICIVLGSPLRAVGLFLHRFSQIMSLLLVWDRWMCLDRVPKPAHAAGKRALEWAPKWLSASGVCAVSLGNPLHCPVPGWGPAASTLFMEQLAMVAPLRALVQDSIHATAEALCCAKI